MIKTKAKKKKKPVSRQASKPSAEIYSEEDIGPEEAEALDKATLLLDVLAAKDAAPTVPTPPAWLGLRGELEWYALGKQLEAQGLFNGHIDYNFFAMYCNQYDTYATLATVIKAEGKMVAGYNILGDMTKILNPRLREMDQLLRHLMRMLQSMGVSPASRDKIKTRKKESPKLALFLGQAENLAFDIENRGRKSPQASKPNGY